MLLEKKKENNHHKKTNAMAPSSEDTVQSLRSWVRKIEQSTNSVSSRLTAVETRLSGGLTSSGETLLSIMEGPAERFFTDIKNGKKKTLDEQARVIDKELHCLYSELEKQKQEFQSLNEHVNDLEQVIPTVQHDLRDVQTTIAQMRSQMEMKTQILEQRKPLVMKLGAMEIPLEVTGIIGGLLAFTIAILVAINQKAVLLSPVFLAGVGMLLIGSALVKPIRMRSRSVSDVQQLESLEPPASHPVSVPYTSEKG